MSGFKHKTLIQARFADFDMMGHINNANYFSFVEYARLKYLDDVIGKNDDWHFQHGLIMGRFEIDFVSPIYYDNAIWVFTRCSKLGNKSFELSWMLADESDENTGKIFAKGKTVIVCYDYHSKKTTEIPAARRQLIEQYENL